MAVSLEESPCLQAGEDVNSWCWMMDIVIFLDFDGATHPMPNKFRSMNDEYLEPFCRLPYIESALDGLNYGVVVSSSWKSSYPPDIIREFLGDKIGKRFLGVTVNLPEDTGSRELEIRAWLKDHGDPKWVAIDDIRDFFMPGCRNLYLVNGKTGFIESDINPFLTLVEKILNDRM